MSAKLIELTDTERQLIETIQQGEDPREIQADWYIPAVSHGIQFDDPSFRLQVRRVTWNKRFEILERTARALSDEELPTTNFGIAKLTFQDSTLKFARWLIEHRPALYDRAVKVVNLGLEPWEEHTMCDLRQQMAVARQAFELLRK